jgi:L-lactate dehydrogenase complex protein LldG
VDDRDAGGHGYRTLGDLHRGPLLDLLAQRVADYRATVRRSAPDQLESAIGAALSGRGARRAVVPPGLALPALPAGIEARDR